MANVKTIIAAHLSQRQRNINKQVERADLLDEDRLLCNIIRVSGNINVPSRPAFVWCQEYSPSDDTSPFHAFNDKVQAREGLTVWVGPGLGGRREVLDWNNATIVNTADYAAQKYLPLHGSDHAWPDFKPGPDVLNVYPRSLTMLRAYPGEGGALTVSVASLRYIKDGALVTFPGVNSFDISASQPASGLARFVGLYLDWDDNTIKSVAGATTSDSPAITPDSPSFPSSAILSVMVRLDGDQTTVSEVDFVDARQVLSFTGPGAVQVSKIWESDFGAVALETDADGNVTINGSRTLTVPTDIIHAGDTDTKIGFTTDQVVVQAGGAAALTATATDVALVGTLTVPSDIIHSSDPDTKISFTDDKVSIAAGGLTLLELIETTQNLVNIGNATDTDINLNDGQLFLRGSNGILGVGTTNPNSNSTMEILTGAANNVVFITQSGAGNFFAGVRIVTDDSGVNFAAYDDGYTDVSEYAGKAGFQGAGGAVFASSIDATGVFEIYTGGRTASKKHFFLDQNGNLQIGPSSGSPSMRLELQAGAMEIEEMTAPGGGAVNSARLYAVDNGAGKTQLVVIFNTGAAQVLATQP